MGGSGLEWPAAQNAAWVLPALPGFRRHVNRNTFYSGRLQRASRPRRSAELSQGEQATMTPQINLVDPGTYERDGIPHDQLSWLREHAPVFWHANGGADGWPGFWAVTRHEDVEHISRHPDTFSSHRQARPVQRNTSGADRAAAPDDAEHGPAAAHAAAQLRQPRLHAADDRPAGEAHSGDLQRADRRGGSSR